MAKQTFVEDLKLAYVLQTQALATPMFKTIGLTSRDKLAGLDEHTRRTVQKFKNRTTRSIYPRGKMLKRMHAIQYASIARALPIVIEALLRNSKEEKENADG